MKLLNQLDSVSVHNGPKHDEVTAALDEIGEVLARRDMTGIVLVCSSAGCTADFMRATAPSLELALDRAVGKEMVGRGARGEPRVAPAVRMFLCSLMAMQAMLKDTAETVQDTIGQLSESMGVSVLSQRVQSPPAQRGEN